MLNRKFVSFLGIVIILITLVLTRMTLQVEATSADLLPNGDFESGSTSKWATTNATLSIVSPGYSSSSHAIKVTRSTGTTYAMFANPKPVTAVPLGQTFQATGKVDGMTGRSICLLLREVSSTGTILQTVKQCVSATGSWQAIGPANLTTKTAGSSIGYLIQQTSALTGDFYQADNLSMINTSTPTVTPTVTPTSTPIITPTPTSIPPTSTPTPSPTVSPTPTITPTPLPGSPCGMAVTPPVRFSHVIWFVFENQSLSDIQTNANLTYTHTLMSQCGLATNFFSEQDPSLPNYIAMTSGGTQGITTDANPTNPGSVTADNIYNEVKQSGFAWRHYAESMPSNCYSLNYPPAPNALYTAHHEPAAYYADISADCQNWMVPQGSSTSGALITDITNDTLPAFSFIGPNDDGGCSSCGGDVDPQKLDGYLQTWLPKIFAMPSYQAGQTAIFITWDEDSKFGGSTELPFQNNVTTIVIAPSVPTGTVSTTSFNHYSMLRTTEEILGITNLLGNAASANDMLRDFNL